VIPRVPILVGEAPARGTLGCFTLFSRSGKRLERLLGGRPFEGVNLIGRALERRESWPRDAARASAELLYRDCFAGREVVLLGRRVADSFRGLSPWTDRLADADFFSCAYPTVRTTRGDWRRCVLWLAPHPSGGSRWWNDRAHRSQARAFFRSILCAEEFPPEPALPTVRPPEAVWPLAETRSWPGYYELPGPTSVPEPTETD
jgi:hypothetical protein